MVIYGLNAMMYPLLAVQWVRTYSSVSSRRLEPRIINGIDHILHSYVVYLKCFSFLKKRLRPKSAVDDHPTLLGLSYATPVWLVGVEH